ncbi:MAG: hypothetical protein QXX41_11615 [Nitrososphaerota archaeon]
MPSVAVIVHVYVVEYVRLFTDTVYLPLPVFVSVSAPMFGFVVTVMFIRSFWWSVTENSSLDKDTGTSLALLGGFGEYMSGAGPPGGGTYSAAPSLYSL